VDIFWENEGENVGIYICLSRYTRKYLNCVQEKFPCLFDRHCSSLVGSWTWIYKNVRSFRKRFLLCQEKRKKPNQKLHLYRYLKGCDNILAKLHTTHPEWCDKVGGILAMHIDDLRALAAMAVKDRRGEGRPIPLVHKYYWWYLWHGMDQRDVRLLLRCCWSTMFVFVLLGKMDDFCH
jgi:hypothetical protein